jgi:hypothetical protein
LEEAYSCFESHLPSIFVTNSDVIVPPSYIELAEEFHSLEIFDTFRKVGEWGYVFACDGVEGSIIYDVS